MKTTKKITIYVNYLDSHELECYRIIREIGRASQVRQMSHEVSMQRKEMQ